MKLIVQILMVVAMCGAQLRAEVESPDPLAWPATVSQSGPWARWWWLGSAVDKPNLTRLMEQYKAAGISGLEVCPIYGAKGFEDRYLDFLSPAWMRMLKHTTDEGQRLNVGVDLTTGTGWPFGGPFVHEADASSRAVFKRYDIAGGSAFKDKLPAGRLKALQAVSDKGEQIDLTARAANGAVDWVAPSGAWKVYAVLEVGPSQKVKRAAPGGEGDVLDPLSAAAMVRYLEHFDQAGAFRGRAQFHDSYEYANATWTQDFFHEFEVRRHYDLRTVLPALFGEGAEDDVARVKDDYRQTISDLHLAYIQVWSDWAHQRGQQTRDQAHGAPANLLDIYGASDIPETELQFGDVNERQIPMLKMSSSAAHVMHKPLASSETFTWLGEHFQVSLGDLKPAADLFFLSGVNHIFFHGVPYSPEDAQWPGWLFYASVNFGPNGGIWHDLPAFNAFLARCQSELRAGQPYSDVLLYFPIHENWESSRGTLIPMGTGDQNKWFWNQLVYQTAMALWKAGIGFDFISDAQIQAGKVDRPIVIPPCKYMPAATAIDLMGRAREGGTVVFEGALPQDVPGHADLEKRRGELRKALGEVVIGKDSNVSAIGKGKVLVGGELLTTLSQVGVHRERMTESGLRFIRRTRTNGRSYYIVNSSDRTIDGWVPLGTAAKSVAILDPRYESRSGFAAVRQQSSGLPQVYLQLLPGESRILRTFEEVVSGREWTYLKPGGEAREIAGEWKIAFIEGGPKMPAEIAATKLASWTILGGEDAKVYAGTARYAIEFDRPAGQADDWVLKLGRVCESARVKVNGKELGTLWCAPFEIAVGGALRPGRNTLEVEVTNVAANRIADMDRRHVNWKAFHEINFVNRNYKPFDASTWPVRDSGLIGPVELAPVMRVRPG
jgi:hypothetical protein